MLLYHDYTNLLNVSNFTRSKQKYPVSVYTVKKGTGFLLVRPKLQRSAWSLSETSGTVCCKPHTSYTFEFLTKLTGRTDIQRRRFWRPSRGMTWTATDTSPGNNTSHTEGRGGSKSINTSRGKACRLLQNWNLLLTSFGSRHCTCAYVYKS